MTSHGQKKQIATNDGTDTLHNNDPYLAEWNAKEHEDCRVEGTGLIENVSVEGGDEVKVRASLMEASDLFAFCQRKKEKVLSSYAIVQMPNQRRKSAYGTRNPTQ